MNNIILEAFHDQPNIINNWISKKQEEAGQPSLYFSSDIRDAGFKVSIVDANLFPAGFNNLSPTSKGYATIFFERYLRKFYPKKKKILLFIEAMTKNKFYLENIHTIKNLLQQSSFEVVVVSDLQSLGIEDHYIIEENQNLNLQIYSLHYLDTKGINNLFDLIILNNDLSSGYSKILAESLLPVIPSIYAGWNYRKKTKYFEIYQKLINEFSQIIKIDPWLLSCFHIESDFINIHEEIGRQNLYNKSIELYEKIQVKYNEHNIKDQPFLFLKDDTGTFGMGLLKIDSPQEILTFNRKKKNKLNKGKDSTTINHYLIQEGVSTTFSFNNFAAEICLYQVLSEYVGSFFRYHKEKNHRDNLNSKGAQFQSITHQKQDVGFIDPNVIHVYSTLSKIIQIASLLEIKENELITTR